jgi:hypothetical protein
MYKVALVCWTDLQPAWLCRSLSDQIRLNAAEQDKDQNDDQNCAKYANAAVAKAIPVTTDNAGEPTE